MKRLAKIQVVINSFFSLKPVGQNLQFATGSMFSSLVRIAHCSLKASNHNWNVNVNSVLCSITSKCVNLKSRIHKANSA